MRQLVCGMVLDSFVILGPGFGSDLGTRECTTTIPFNQSNSIPTFLNYMCFLSKPQIQGIDIESI